MAALKNWNFFKNNVQSGLTEGQFINSSSTLLAAGPPFLVARGQTSEEDLTYKDVVYPIGLTSTWSIQQNLSVIPIPEAGSYHRYTITGPARGQMSLGRTLYHGPSMLKVLYAYYQAKMSTGEPLYSLLDNKAANQARNPHNTIYSAPGYDNFYMNLASDLFTQPIGLLMYIKDVNKESYGAVYLEQVQVGSHGMGGGPQSVVISEQVSCTFSRARPVKLSNPVPLMSRFQDSGVITSAGTQTDGKQRIQQPTGTNI